MNDYHVRGKLLHIGDSKVPLNPFLNERNPASEEWFKKLFTTYVTNMVDSTLQARKGKLKEEEDIVRQRLSDGEMLLAKDALELGLIDKIQSPDAYFNEYFKGKEVRFSAPQ